MAPTAGSERRVTHRDGGKVDSRADALVARLAADQYGVVSLDELRGCGLSYREVEVRVANGRLHPLHRGVYAVGHPNPPLEGRFLAAVKACGPTAALSHHSCACLLDFAEWDGRRIEVTVRGETTRVHRGIKVHRTNRLEPADVMRHRGMRVTTPARTLLDLAATLPRTGLRRAARQAQGLQRVNIRQLTEVLHRSPGCRGTRNLARIVATGPAPTRSELESLVLDLILRGGLEHPDVNRPLRINGRRVIPDFRWPDQHLVVEADGSAWHDNQLAREDDAERQALLEAHGERVLRVTWDQALLRPAQTLNRMRAAGALTVL